MSLTGMSIHSTTNEIKTPTLSFCDTVGKATSYHIHIPRESVHLLRCSTSDAAP